MTQPEVSRRAFLGGAAAVAAAAVVPALPAAAAIPETVLSNVHTVTATVAKPMFGFSTHGDVWEIDFPTREAALKAAREYHDGDTSGGHRSFCVGEVQRIRIHIPDGLNEAAAQALIDGGEVFDHLTEYLAGCNEDSDFDGEMHDSIAAAWKLDHEEMDAQCRAVIAAAMIRAGDPVSAARAATSDRRKHKVSDEMFEALASDATLQADLHRIFTAWVDKHDLWEAGYALSTSNVEQHLAMKHVDEAEA